MKYAMLLSLLFLMIPTVYALNIVVYDSIDGFSDFIQIYQNDNNSDNYIKSVNIEGNETDLEPFSLGDGFGYTIQLEPDYHTELGDIKGGEFLSYWFNYIRYYLAFIIILIMAVILWRYFYKGY